MIKYKLTEQNMQTHNGFQWVLGETNRIKIKGNEMCSREVFHGYDSPLLAVLFNPIHANIKRPLLFKCRVGKIVAHDGLKFGTKTMTLIAQLELPQISLNQKIAFGILCALGVYKNKSFKNWAKKWLNGEDKTANTAYAAANTAYSADAAYAAYAAYAAAYAAYAAAYAADAAYAAYAAAYAADAADAAYSAAKIDLVALAERAMQYKD